MKVKLGQQIKFTKNHTIKLFKGGSVEIKPGDTARVVKKVDDKTAEIVYLTGEAKGKSQNILLEVDDTLDADSIAKKILSELNK